MGSIVLACILRFIWGKKFQYISSSSLKVTVPCCLEGMNLFYKVDGKFDNQNEILPVLYLSHIAPHLGVNILRT